MFAKEIKLRNFKSFPNSTIRLERGFNAIVGPNGSGKSNVIDSLLFSFGESSLKSMRVKKTSDLIFGSNKVAEVAITLGDSKGGGSHTISRLVKRDGKTKYVLDGRRTKKYALEDFLSGSCLSLANIIKQGEVQKIVEMSGKDRRALIDIVANVAEYEDKKREALGELDRVEAKLKESAAILAEREGYLKELEQEKDNAIAFKALKEERDSLKATLLSIDFNNLEKEFESVIKSMLDRDNRLAAVMERMRGLEAQIDAKNAAKDEIHREIMARSQGADADLQRGIDALAMGIENAKKAIGEKGGFLKGMDEKYRSRKLELQRAADEVGSARSQLAEVERETASLQKILAERTAEYNSLLAKSTNFSQKFHDARAFVEKANEQMLTVKERLTQLQAEVGKNDELVRMKEAEIGRIHSGEFEDFGERKKALEAQMKEHSNSLKHAQAELDGLFDSEKRLNERLPVLEDLFLEAREKVVEINSRLRNSSEGQASKALEAVMELREKLGGIEGTVEDCCTYSSKYAVPVQVAMGNRGNFLIVDSAKTAGRGISVLKERKLGRLSFIPLDKIHAPAISEEDRRLSQKPGSLGFLIDFLQYDGKHLKAMEFVATNTLVMEDLKSAGPLIGKIRMVTLEGELVEGSGLLSGGSYAAKISVTAERKQLSEWEKKLESSKGEKEGVLEQLRELRDSMGEARRRKAEADLALKAIEIQLAHVAEQEKSELKKKSHLVDAIDALKADAQALRDANDRHNEERSGLIRELSDLNVRMLEAKQQIDFEKEEQFGVALKERERAIGDLRVSLAEYESRGKSLGTQFGVYSKQEAALRKELSEEELEGQKAEDEIRRNNDYVEKSREELRLKLEEQKRLSTAFSSLINRREGLEGEITKIGNEKGKVEFEREKIERDAGDEKVRRAVLENQLATLKAALDEFSGVMIFEGRTVKDKPELVARSKIVAEKVDSLGDVNLRAIDLYGQRAAEFAEQKEKVGRLFNEKEAVIHVINEIEGRKTSTFMDAFDKVNENFKKVFSQIFRGEGTLFLENAEKPFEGGLTIQVKLENKEVKYLELMSGGEKSLIALIFIFALQSFNPSSLYILDEADAALDAENSRKLAALLKALSRDTQFIVVTHNQALYKHADALIGVAMTREGSRLVEVKLNGPGAEKATAAPSPHAPGAEQKIGAPATHTPANAAALPNGTATPTPAERGGEMEEVKIVANAGPAA